MPNVFVRNYLIFTAIMFGCASLLGYILISGDQKIDKSDDWITHTHKVIIESEELNALISSMLASQRGYILSKDDGFLNEYKSTKTDISLHISALSDLTSDNPSQQVRLGELRQYFVEFSKELERRTALTATSSPSKILSDVRVVDDLRDNIRRINADFLAEEYKLLDQRVGNLEQRKEQYFLTLMIGGGTAFVLIMLFNGYLLRVQSKRTIAEAALSDKEAIFRLAMEGTNDGVFDWNIKTGHVFYSDQFIRMLGYEPHEFKGNFEDFADKLHPDEESRVREYVELYLGGELSEYSNTFRVRHKSGRWIWINSRAKLIMNKAGEPTRMVGAHTDISASKEYERRLQDAKINAENANRAKSDFLAHMSHEIRTPLTTISGVAEILEQNNDELDEKKKRLVTVLNKAAVTLKDLITDVLDFSKIESGEMELEESSFALADAFEHVVSIMSVRALEKGLDFAFSYNEVKETYFYGDPIRLRQILINLIGNATKFTNEGHVHVEASKEDRNGSPVLLIKVKDTGIGVAQNQFDLVFERFKQADSSESRKHGGTGLGLPISKKLAVLMGGDIELSSKVGEGSTFTLVLPLRHVEGSESDQNIDEVRKAKLNDKLRSAVSNTDKILLVEDYEGNIVVLSYVLEDMGCAFDVAKTGLEALNMWKQHHYDLVLMDIQMPEMDGFTATAHIRNIEEEESLDRTPIIGMTAHALVGDKDKCIEAGMDAYLPKPIVEMDFKAAILKFIKQKHSTS